MFFKVLLLLLALVLDKCSMLKPEVSPVRKEPTAFENRVKSNDISGTWRQEFAPADSAAKDQKSASVSNNNKSAHIEAVISFFPDSTFTEIQADGKYIHGTYLFGDSTIEFQSNRESRSMQLTFNRDDYGRRIMHIAAKNSQPVKNYAEYAYPLPDYTADPFHSVHNKWRIKPSGPENTAQIHLRLVNYLQHNCKILKSATDRNQGAVSWEFSEGILKFYNVGVGLVPRDKIPESWLDTFQSHDQALSAYDQMEKLIYANKYKAAPSGNWAKDDYNILSDLYDQAQHKLHED